MLSADGSYIWAFFFRLKAQGGSGNGDDDAIICQKIDRRDADLQFGDKGAVPLQLQGSGGSGLEMSVFFGNLSLSPSIFSLCLMDE